jgi:hypothetical protein
MIKIVEDFQEFCFRSNYGTTHPQPHLHLGVPSDLIILYSKYYSFLSLWLFFLSFFLIVGDAIIAVAPLAIVPISSSLSPHQTIFTSHLQMNSSSSATTTSTPLYSLLLHRIAIHPHHRHPKLLWYILLTILQDLWTLQLPCSLLQCIIPSPPPPNNNNNNSINTNDFNKFTSMSTSATSTSSSAISTTPGPIIDHNSHCNTPSSSITWIELCLLELGFGREDETAAVTPLSVCSMTTTTTTNNDQIHPSNSHDNIMNNSSHSYNSYNSSSNHNNNSNNNNNNNNNNNSQQQQQSGWITYSKYCLPEEELLGLMEELKQRIQTS